MTEIIKRFGWLNSIPDQRDTLYKFAPPLTEAQLPPKADLRPNIDWMYDQGNEGSCTAQSSASAVRFERKRAKLSEIDPSRNFLYWNERNMEGDIKTDAGAQIRTAMKVLNQYGICHENLWDYGPSTMYATPAKAAYSDAAKNVVSLYSAVDQNHSALRACLADGHPFVFGFAVYSSFLDDSVTNTGVVPMPTTSEEQKGGHAVLAVGYDDASRMYIVMNSWSNQWGDKGFFYMPYAYLEDPGLADDFWTIRGFKEVIPVLKPTPSPYKPKPYPKPWWAWW